MTALSMDLCLSQEPRLEQKLILELPVEVSGDIPLLSLHRIRHRIPTLDLNPDIRHRLVSELFDENRGYREETGRNWYCITGSGLDHSVDQVRAFLTRQMEVGVGTVDDRRRRAAIKNVLRKQIDAQDAKIKGWFYDNYDELIYNTRGQIPYPVVRRMREQLAQWALANTNPFQQPIQELIEETARSVGLDPNKYESYMDMWEDLKGY